MNRSSKSTGPVASVTLSRDTLDFVTAAQAGDDSAANHLFRRICPQVVWIVSLRLGRRLCEIEEQEDLVQGALLGAWGSLRQFSPQVPLVTGSDRGHCRTDRQAEQQAS